MMTLQRLFAHYNHLQLPPGSHQCQAHVECSFELGNVSTVSEGCLSTEESYSNACLSYSDNGFFVAYVYVC